VRSRALLAIALLAAACGEDQYVRPPPSDVFVYPTGLATTRLPSGANALVVVSSNFDLNYDPTTGGTLATVDPTAIPETSVSPFPPLAQLGFVTLPSMGGQVAVADPDSCPGTDPSAAEVVLASRYSTQLVRARLAADGALACESGCIGALPYDGTDPFGIGLACRLADPAAVPPIAARRLAFVGYLDTNGSSGLLSFLDLQTGAVGTLTSLAGAPYGIAYDADQDRIWIPAAKVLGLSGWISPLISIDLAAEGTAENPTYNWRVETYDLWPYVPGADLRGIALSNPVQDPNHPGVNLPRRAYVAARVYDPVVAQSLGFPPSYDIGAVLFVIDLANGPSGVPPRPLPVLKIVPIGLGAGEIRVLPPRPGRRDLVAITSITDGLLTIYDDETGAIAKVFGIAQTATLPENPARVPMGTPLVGKQPFGLATELRDGLDWIYVGSFVSNTVTAVSLDPLDPAGAQIRWAQERMEP
jgi:hypothetical protein